MAAGRDLVDSPLGKPVEIEEKKMRRPRSREVRRGRLPPQPQHSQLRKVPAIL